MVLTLCELAVSHNQPQKCILWFTCCVLVIYNKKLDFSEDLSQLLCELSPFDLIRNLFKHDQVALSRLKQTAFSSLSEKKNMLARRWELEVYEVEWLNPEWVNPLEQCSSCSGGLPVLIPHEVFTKSRSLFFKRLLL